MEELVELKSALSDERPVEWEQFPDIGLYMDQVVSYMPRQLINSDGNVQLTSAMVNNYIKYGLLPRSEGKKYSRPHLALLTAICMLKQVLSVKDVDLLLKEEIKEKEIKNVYTDYMKVLDDSLMETSKNIDSEMTIDQLSHAALKLAVSSYCEKIACEKMIEIIRKNTPGTKPEKATKKPPAHSESIEQGQ